MGKKLPLCPVETTARILGGRWRAAILDHLFHNPRRFSELKRLTPGLTQRTLSAHLRELQAAGIVDREVLPASPPKVVYAITPLGESLRPLLEAMCEWGTSHEAAMAMRKMKKAEEVHRHSGADGRQPSA
jgi:DNA-binding HxlR family transcriptional regulator